MSLFGLDEKTVDEISKLVNSRGFIAFATLTMLGWVLYTLLGTITAIPGKLDVIIVKLEQCARNSSVAAVPHKVTSAE